MKFEQARQSFIKLFIIIVISGFFSACFLSKKKYQKKEKEYYLRITSPGCVKAGKNFFYDQTESTNLDWLEYMYWTRRVFGDNSEEYKSILPDTTVWLEKYPCLNYTVKRYIHNKDTTFYLLSFPLAYLRHPSFREYPVVGISQKQAKAYAKWRSDRVFEFILIKYRKIKMNPDQNRDNYFTIENYYNGKYNNYKPDSNFRYYPEYRLPTIKEWQSAVQYADSVDKTYYQKNPKLNCNDCKTKWSDFQSDVVPCVNDTFKNYPTVAVTSFKGSPFYNLRGNVSEWTSEKNICIGGGWADSKERIMLEDTFSLKTQNAWTGFRNVCEWKEWKK